MSPNKKKIAASAPAVHDHALRSKGKAPTATSSGTKLQVVPRRRIYSAFDAFKKEKMHDKSLGKDMDQRLSAIATMWKGLTVNEKKPYAKKAGDMNRLRDLHK